MNNKEPKVGVAIIVIKDNKILLGLLTKKWLYKGVQVYGVPGRSIRFGEKIGDTVKRDMLEDLGVKIISYKIFSVNANYAYENHYIEIGVIAEIEGEIRNRVPEDWETWEWFDLSKIPSNLFPSAKNAIECYLQKLVSVSV